MSHAANGKKIKSGHTHGRRDSGEWSSAASQIKLALEKLEKAAEEQDEKIREQAKVIHRRCEDVTTAAKNVERK